MWSMIVINHMINHVSNDNGACCWWCWWIIFWVKLKQETSILSLMMIYDIWWSCWLKQILKKLLHSVGWCSWLQSFNRCWMCWIINLFWRLNYKNVEIYRLGYQCQVVFPGLASCTVPKAISRLEIFHNTQKKCPRYSFKNV